MEDTGFSPLPRWEANNFFYGGASAYQDGRLSLNKFADHGLNTVTETLLYHVLGDSN